MKTQFIAACVLLLATACAGSALAQSTEAPVSIDGQEVVSFSSAGIAHPTKRMLRLAIHRNVVVDDLKIYSLDH